ncbi:hypothetical protein GCM10027072_76180 [Streptomyces bullii]
MTAGPYPRYGRRIQVPRGCLAVPEISGCLPHGQADASRRLPALRASRVGRSATRMAYASRNVTFWSSVALRRVIPSGVWVPALRGGGKWAPMCRGGLVHPPWRACPCSCPVAGCQREARPGLFSPVCEGTRAG